MKTAQKLVTFFVGIASLCVSVQSVKQIPPVKKMTSEQSSTTSRSEAEFLQALQNEEVLSVEVAGRPDICTR